MRLGNTGRAGAQRCHLTKLREVKELFSPRSQLSLPPEERFRRQLEYEELISGLVDGRSPAVTFSRVMEHFGLSHKDLADELMCSDRTVHRWFGSSGELPTVKNILMFSIAFCLSIDVCLALLKSLHCSLWPEDVRYVELLLRNYPGQAVESLPLVDCMCLKMPRFR